MPVTPCEQRARVGAAVRHHGPKAPEAVAARRDLAEAKLAKYIRKVVDEAPPLTAAQIEELSLLLGRRKAEGRSE